MKPNKTARHVRIQASVSTTVFILPIFDRAALNGAGYYTALIQAFQNRSGIESPLQQNA